MTNRSSPVREARRHAAWVVVAFGREVRVARYRSGMTQRRVGALVGRSASCVSRIEAGKVPGVSVRELAMVSAAVGLKLYMNAYPGGRRPLDAPQLQLLQRFRTRIHRSWGWELEKVVPREGDLRAADAFLSQPGCTCAVEAITRLAEVQGHVRPARAKQRDLGATRLILLVAATRANRRILHESAGLLREAFPVSTRVALRRLSLGQDPGGDCLILL